MWPGQSIDDRMGVKQLGEVLAQEPRIMLDPADFCQQGGSIFPECLRLPVLDVHAAPDSGEPECKISLVKLPVDEGEHLLSNLSSETHHAP